MFSFELCLTFLVFGKDEMLLNLINTQFVVQRAFVLWNKLCYILVSFITAFKNKKQRIKFQWICFALQLTVLLPYFLFVLVVSTLLDTATIPYLGFAFFLVGYPKP